MDLLSICFVNLLATFAIVAGQNDILEVLGHRPPNKRPGQRAVLIPPSGRHDFWIWPNNTVNYYFDTTNPYTDEEKAQMKEAMAKVQAGTKDCVRYQEIPRTSRAFKLKITATEKDGSPAKYCSGWPGIYKPYLAHRMGEQRLVIAKGDNGCMGGNYGVREQMKLFAIATGVRNQHQRADRDTYLGMNISNVIPGLEEQAFKLHPIQSFLYLCNYDYCSITHNQPQDFAREGLRSFTVKKAPYFIPKLERLSGCDCREITEIYKCTAAAAQCEYFDCEAQAPPPGEELPNVPPPPLQSHGPPSSPE